MLILKQSAQAETKVKNSRFLAEAIPVQSPDEAKELWHWRKENYDNGGHIVYAFTVGANQNISGCSDDGEPSGTAGRPVLAVLLGSGLTNAMITVARWFGGTKLGTGGLVHAYGDAAKAVLEVAEFTEYTPVDTVQFTLPYQLYSTAKVFLDGIGFTAVSEDFAGEITICGTIRQSKTPELRKFLMELGNGKIPFAMI
jgi:uncharacterized YigZ family protein